MERAKFANGAAIHWSTGWFNLPNMLEGIAVSFAGSSVQSSFVIMEP